MNISKFMPFKLLKYLFGFVVGILFLMLIFPMFFPDLVTNKVKEFANERINGEIDFSDVNLSFFNHFPSLTLTLEDFLLKGSDPYKNDTLVSSKEISLGINIKNLIFNSSVDIEKIFIDEAFVNIKVNKEGFANYNIYKSDEISEESESSAQVRLNKIEITNTKLIYDDLSTDIYIKTEGFNYVGKGDLDQAVFDLKTKARIESFDFRFAGQEYLKNKQVNADLITQINTNSLSFVFNENNLKINKLPIEFKGKFDFLSNGYDIDFLVNSDDSDLYDFFTALPPQFVTWLDNTKVKGKTDIMFSLKGKYIASENLSPDLDFKFKLRNGYVLHGKSPIAAENIFVNFETKLPSLDPNRLEVVLDSIYLDLGKDYFSGVMNLKNMSKPDVNIRIKSRIDLGELTQIVGFDYFNIKGKLDSNLTSKGVFDKENGLFPVTNGHFNFTEGYLKTPYYPNPIKNINFTSKIHSKSGKLYDLSFSVNKASLLFENKEISSTVMLRDFNDLNYKIKANGELDLGKIYKVFALEGLDVDGLVKADVSFNGKQSDVTNGRYDKLNNQGVLELFKIATRSKFLPKPFVVNSGKFEFNQNRMSFNNLQATYGSSDFVMNGYMENVINFVFSEKEILKGNFKLQSNYLNLDEFMSEVVTVKDTLGGNLEEVVVESGVFMVPDKFDFNFYANAKQIDFQDIKIKNLQGNTLINNGAIYLNKVNFGVIGSTATIDAKYQNIGKERADFNFKIKASDFDIKRAYNEIKLFRDMASAAQNASGIVSLDYSLDGVLNQDMSPIFPSLSGGGVLSVKNVKMKGFKLFNAVSSKTSTSALKDPDLSKIDIKTTIKNNIINIERFKFKVAGFRPRFEGQSSFDGKLSLKMRLGLPPLGIIGIPIKVTGTQDNPKIGLGRQTEEIDETEYDESELIEIRRELHRRDSINQLQNQIRVLDSI